MKLCWEATGGALESYVRGPLTKQVDSSKTSDEGFGLFRNRVPAWTLKFNFGIGSLLGEGGGIASIERRVATKENVSDNGCTER